MSRGEGGFISSVASSFLIVVALLVALALLDIDGLRYLAVARDWVIDVIRDVGGDAPHVDPPGRR